MSALKRVFITPYLLAQFVAVVYGAIALVQGRWPWAALLLSALPVSWITLVHTLVPHRARTPRRYPSFLVLAGLGWAASFLGWPDLTPVVWGGLQFGGLFAYLNWYSEFGVTKSRYLAVGEELPVFFAQNLEGQRVTSLELRGSPALILFYRGNWCPVCTAQIHELAREYAELETRGIRVILISPQPDTHSQALSKKVSLPFEFWIDRDNVAALALNIVDPAGLPLGMEALGYGSETPLPTAILVDAHGRILYSDQAENYRIRPEPKDYLEAFDRALGGQDLMGTAPTV